jgi:hypothetical protein
LPGRVGRVDRLRDDALIAELEGVAPDQFTVASFMSVELQARFLGENRLKQRLALEERQACPVAAVDMEKIEGVKDQAYTAPPPVAACVSAKLGRPSSPTPHNSPSR